MDGLWFVTVKSSHVRVFVLSQWKREFLSPRMEKAGRGTGLGRNIRSLFFGGVEFEMPVSH